MSRLQGSKALCALAVASLALAVPACSGKPKADSPQSAAPASGRREPLPERPPSAPEIAVRIVNGDTSRPVKGAIVVARGEKVRTAKTGVAAVGYPRTRATVRVAARGYESRKVEVTFGRRLVQTVSIWQPALQWPIYGVNPARTQVQPRINIRPPFRVVWSRNIGGLLEFPAVVWNGVAYVNNIHGVLQARLVENGRLLWRRSMGTLVASSPAIDPKRGVLVTTTMRPGDVKVVSMKTGRVRWRYPLGARSEPSPVIRGRLAYFAAEDGNVYALDLERRRMRWVFHGGAKITSSPSLVGNRLYIGDYAGRVFALDARTGHRIWTGSAGTRVYGTVAVSGGRVFAPSVFSGLSALSARTGRLLWRFPVGAYLYSSPAVFRNRVYFGTYAGYVYCADARSGRILWSRGAGGRVSGAVEVVAGVVYAGSLERRITAWNWRTGRTLWTFPHGQYVPVSGNSARLLIHGPARIWAVEPKRRR